jgi:hypothetical protein
MIYLFLDFDGVLHGTEYHSIHFEHLQKWMNCLLPYQKDIQVIISSSWREEHSFEHLLNFFPKNFRNFIQGITPTLPENMKDGMREKEILLYLEEHHLKNEPWIALDDDMRLFSQEQQILALRGHGNVIFTEKSTGLSDTDLIILQLLIEKKLQ